MLNLMLSKARPGMTLAMPVFHPGAAGHVLLKPGFALDSRSICRLGELKVPDVWIDCPALAEVMKYVSHEVVGAQADLVRTIGPGFDAAQGDARVDLEFSAYAGAVRGLIARLGEHPSAQTLVNDLVHSDSALTSHSTAVSYLSILMGLKLDSYLMLERSHVGPTRARSVEGLGVGALLHDVGILRLDPETVRRAHRTGNFTDPAWREHVKIGYEMVRGEIEPTAASAVLHHHQRFNGSGFPGLRRADSQHARPQCGHDIHIFARVIAVADRFDDLRNPIAADGTVRRSALPVVRVIKQMLAETRAGHFDPMVIKSLVQCAPAFGPGKHVTLSDGREAVVTGQNPLDPCRPKVRPIIAGREHMVPEDHFGPVIDLQKSLVSIAKVDGEDVHDDLFFPSVPSEFDLRVMPPNTQPVACAVLDAA